MFLFNTLVKRFKISATRATIARRVLYPRVVDKNVDVVLLRDVAPYGRSGEIKEVSRGLANHKLIPHGLAVYATWENIDNYASDGARKYQDKDTNVSIDREKDNASGGFFGDAPPTVVASFKAKTLSKHPSCLCTPISLYSVLDSLAKSHQIDILPEHVLRVVDHESGSNCSHIAHFTHIGKYDVHVKLPLLESPDNVFIFQVELVDYKHRLVVL